MLPMGNDFVVRVKPPETKPQVVRDNPFFCPFTPIAFIPHQNYAHSEMGNPGLIMT